jgi:hypothetical protein
VFAVRIVFCSVRGVFGLNFWLFSVVFFVSFSLFFRFVFGLFRGFLGLFFCPVFPA